MPSPENIGTRRPPVSSDPKPEGSTTLKIHLFGSFSLSRGDEPLPPFPTQKARRLFCFLVLYRDRFFPREVLIGNFWGDRPEEVARKSLRTAMWRIRKVLEPEGSDGDGYLLSTSQGLGFNTGTDYWLDVEEFERVLSTAERQEGTDADVDDATTVEQLLKLYRGELLEGVYDEWNLYEQQRLKGMLVTALERALYRHQSSGRWPDAIDLARRLLGFDPHLEHVHRDLMRCYCAVGNRPKAIQQFEICADILKREFRIEPMPETLALYTEIRDGRQGLVMQQPGAFPIRRPRGEITLDEKVDRALARLQAAQQSLDEARKRLRRGLEDVERLLGKDKR